jgi:hypothetical protein
MPAPLASLRREVLDALGDLRGDLGSVNQRLAGVETKVDGLTSTLA